MLLKTLTLKNFRKFKNTTIDFPDGVTGVVGLNGVGKSTIFEAIAWVLYGPVAARTSSEEIKRQGAETSETCRVEIEFVFEEDNIRVVREMRGKNFTSQATATVNGKVAATSTESVTRFIRKKLGMDFKSFFTSIFARQKELNTLSSMNASERRPLILRMLGIDSLDEIIKEIRSDKKTKESYIERLNEDLTDKNGNDKKVIFEHDLKNKEKEKKELEKIIENEEKKIKKLKEGKIETEKKYKNSKKEYEKLNKTREELNDKKTLFDNKKKLENEIEKLKEKINKRKENIDTEKKKLKDFEKVEHDFKSVEMRLEDINNHLEKLVKKIEKNNAFSDRIDKDIEESKEKRKKIEEIGPDAKCPTCERVLSGQYNVLLDKFDKDLNEKQKQKENYKEENESIKKEKERINREKEALKKKRNYLQSELRKKDKIESTLDHINSEIRKEKNDYENKKKILDDIGKIDFDIKEFESIKKKVEKAYNNYQEILESFNNKKDELSNLAVAIEKKQGEKKLINQNISTIKEKINTLKDSKEKIKQEKNALKYLGLLSNIMSDFRTYLISRIRPTLSSYASDFYRRLTDGKYSEIELDENYNVLIYDDGESFGIERFSGGEEDLANLCLRLSISEFITERAGGIFNFIILDEIFGSQDNIRRQNIMKALNALSSKFRQIFIITHVDEIKNYVENIIQVTEKEDGASSLKIE